MQIIPAIDLIDGKLVRLTEGDYQRKTDYGMDPLEMARRYEEAGFTRLHVVDLDGARKGQVINWEVLEDIVSNTNLEIDFGGGVKTEEEVKRLLGLGVHWVTVGSIAVKHPEIFDAWIDRYGADVFFLGADVRGRMIAVSGWMETSNMDVFSFIRRYRSKGINHIFCTDISKDGMLQGPSTDLYSQIISMEPGIELVASGGVSSLADLEALRTAGCHAAIVGKAIYENRISLDELKNFQHDH